MFGKVEAQWANKKHFYPKFLSADSNVPLRFIESLVVLRTDAQMTEVFSRLATVMCRIELHAVDSKVAGELDHSNCLVDIEQIEIVCDIDPLSLPSFRDEVPDVINDSRKHVKPADLDIRLGRGGVNRKEDRRPGAQSRELASFMLSKNCAVGIG